MVTSHGKNDFAEGSKILLDTDLKIILSDQKNFVGIFKIMSNAANNFDILATGFCILHNCSDSSTKLLFGLYPAKILDFSCFSRIANTKLYYMVTY